MTAGHPVFNVLGQRFDQLGIVVADLERALRMHEGLGPWSVYTYDCVVVPNLQARGLTADFRFRLALNPDDPQLELIQPLDDRSPYAAWLASRGAGLHHLGYLVDDVLSATRRMDAAGVEVIMSGSGHGADGTGAFTYYDTGETLGYITEAIQRPLRRREPEAVWP